LPFLRRYWGGVYGAPGDRVFVQRFSDARAVTVASIRFLDPSGWQVRQERRIFFVKNRFLLIRDRFTVPTDMAVAAGPLWHARDLASERGSHFFDLYNRQPLNNIWRMRNPERHALVYFVPRPGTDSDAFEVEAYLPPPDCPRDSATRVSVECRGGPPFVAFQRWVGEARAGETRWFDTLILPHGPSIGAHQLAQGIHVLEATDGVALEIDMGTERWLVLDNPAHREIQLPGLSTDAHYAVARTAPDKRPYLLTSQASRIQWGEILRTWPVETSVELGGELPPRRLPGW
jgi:hypothetical protein